MRRSHSGLELKAYITLYTETESSFPINLANYGPILGNSIATISIPIDV